MLTSGSRGLERADYQRWLKAFAGSHIHVGDVDEGDAGLQGLLYALGEHFGGDPGVGEVAVDEAGAGNRVEGERRVVPFAVDRSRPRSQGVTLHSLQRISPGEAQGMVEQGDSVPDEVWGLGRRPRSSRR